MVEDGEIIEKVAVTSKLVKKRAKRKSIKQADQAKKAKKQAEKQFKNQSKTVLNASDVTKKVVCSFWMEGKCVKEDACTFSHDVIPNKTRAEAMQEEICKYFITDSCINNNCPYSHNLKLLACRFFHVKKKCWKGDDCKYSHEPISEAELRKLKVEMETLSKTKVGIIPSILESNDAYKNIIDMFREK